MTTHKAPSIVFILNPLACCYVKEDESDTGSQFNVATAAAPVKPPVPVVKAKASSLMNTLMISK